MCCQHGIYRWVKEEDFALTWKSKEKKSCTWKKLMQMLIIKGMPLIPFSYYILLYPVIFPFRNIYQIHMKGTLFRCWKRCCHVVWEPAVFFLQITDYNEVVAPKIRTPVHQIFIKIYLFYDQNNLLNEWLKQAISPHLLRADLPMEYRVNSTYTRILPNRFSWGIGSLGRERRIYVQTHTAAFLNSDMSSKAEQKTSVSST